MGLSIHLAEVILLEHLYRPLPETVHTIGRPFTGFDESQMLRMFERRGLTPRPYSLIYDDYTTEAKARYEKTGHRFLSHRTFFEALGVEKVSTIDISDYEGADIVCNLCAALPTQYHGSADFIVGGSTLDNVFDPALYLRNIVTLLRQGGRLVEINHSNDHQRPYVILTPPWYFDYFVVNGFRDCKAYVWEFSSAVHTFKVLVPYHEHQETGWGLIENFEGPGDLTLCVVLIAEKDTESTSDAVPTQDAYRSAEEVAHYNSNLKKIVACNRPFQEQVIDGIVPISKPPGNYTYAGHFPILDE